MKTIVSIIVIAVIVVGGYLAFKPSDSTYTTDQNATTTGSTATTTASDGKKMAFSEFVKQGGAYKCTVNQNVGDTTSVGTTYINSGMIRGEYNTKVQNISIDTTMIVRDGYTYSWSSMTPTTGFKVKLAATTSADTSTGTSGSYSFNTEQIGDYNCEVWTVDNSKFTIPAGVTFQEI